ncbi:MAG: cupredoxin domain-containing protein [Chloroflexi bacterium]|nr:cupredoxin domain-containing protein [Chloroflexota bacterium]
MKKKLSILGVVLLLSLMLAACSGTSSSTNGSTTLSVTTTDFKFTPSTWTVPAGKQITVNITNNGALGHTWTVMTKPITGSFTSADQSDVYFTSGVIQPSTSSTVTFTAPSTAGTYQVICTQPGHFEQGMVGSLIVK